MKMKNLVENKKLKGFTVVEILFVVIAVFILIGVVLFAINPPKQLEKSRDNQRKLDTEKIIKAIYEYNVSKNGTFPSNILLANDCYLPILEICKTDAESCSGLTDLNSYLTEEYKFLNEIPTDPSASSINGTGYSVYKDKNTEQIVVCATHSETEKTISVTR